MRLWMTVKFEVIRNSLTKLREKKSGESLRLWLRFKRRNLKTFVQQIFHRKVLSDIEKHCLFIGYPRSGHTLVAALLDAHPNIVISKGVDPLQYLGQGFTLRQIYCLYLRQARRFAKHGGKSNGYSYLVPNQWNGKFSQLKVLGDKSGDLLSERLLAAPDILDEFLRKYPAEHKLIHVIRNPFDSITTLSTRNQLPLGDAINHYFALSRKVEHARLSIDPGNWINVRLEEIISDPQTELARLCRFLGQETSPAYLRDCASFVFASPRQTRFKIEWTPHLIHRVETELKKFPLLSGYTFESVNTSQNLNDIATKMQQRRSA